MFKNHASYQASWATTSTACNSYPFSSNTTYFPAHIFQQQPIFQFIFSSNTTYFPVHIFQQHNIFSSSYFPTTQPIFQFIFSRSEKKKNKKQHAYTNIMFTKIACYSNQATNMQTGNFFSFQLIKTAYTHSIFFMFRSQNTSILNLS